jgi:hypothetical protein
VRSSRYPAGPIRRRPVLAVLASITLLAAGCGHPQEQAPPPPRTTHAVRGTMSGAAVGDRLVITASVDRVLSAGSFVVRDVDLPAEGLLVLAAHAPDGLAPAVLLQLDGTVALFRYRDIPRALLGEASLYRVYEGKKVLIADRVQAWLAPSPAAPSASAPSAAVPRITAAGAAPVPLRR